MLQVNKTKQIFRHLKKICIKLYTVNVQSDQHFDVLSYSVTQIKPF